MNKTTKTIEIDFDVYKALNNQTTYFDEPFNDVLRRLLLSNPIENKVSNSPSTKKELEFINRKAGVEARGIKLSTGGIKVLKGSKFRKTAASKFNGSYAALRNQMIKEQRFDSNFELKEDYEFDSLSAAASVIVGSQRNANPWK